MKDLKKIYENILFMSAGEFFTRLLNFITYAYLARVILPSGFGSINFASAFVSFFILFVSFGFDTVATRNVSISPEKIPSYLTNISITKFALGIIFYLMLFLIVRFSNQDELTRQALLVYGLSIFSNVLLISWVYRAIEKTFPVAFAQFAGGLFNLTAVVVLIRHQSQIIDAIWIIVISGFVNSLIMILILKKYIGPFKFDFNIKLAGDIFKKASPVALSMFMITVYYNMDQVMLGFMTTKTELGFYAASYKILLAAIIPSSIILNAFFPRLSKSYEDIPARKSVMKRYSVMMFGSGMFIGLTGLLLGEQIVSAVYGKAFLPAAPLLTILMINSVFIFMNMTYGNPLLAWGMEKKYLIAITAGAVSNIILNLLLIPEYHAAGAAIATLSSEIVVLIGVGYFHYKFTGNLYLKKFLILSGISVFTFFTGKFAIAQDQNILISFTVVVLIFVSSLLLTRFISVAQIKRLLSHEI